MDVGLIGDGQVRGEQRLFRAASYRYLIEALKLVFSGAVSALVTCPITKKSVQSAGIPFMGHTELLANYAGVSDYVMMLMNPRLKVSLATIHVP